MTNANTIGTKLARDIKVGDRILYKSGDLIDYSDYSNPWTNLSGDVLGRIELADDEVQLSTSSGWLKVIPGAVELTLVDGDCSSEVQSQYNVKPAEVFSRVSIE